MTAKKKRRGKEYIHLLKNKDIKRWYENLSRGSIITADVYLRRLGKFCSDYKITPKKIINMEEKELYDFLMDCITELENKDYKGSYIDSIIKAIKSWLTHNGIEIKRKIKIKDSKDAPTLKDERIPTQDELKKIFLSADKASRVSCAIVAHSGLRLQSLGDYMGRDGLTIGDFPELKIEDDEVIFEKIPTLLRVRKELSKTKHQYFSFLSEEGCEYLKDYLEERMRRGEELTNNTAIITPKIRTNKPFITTINIGDSIRKSLRKAGYQWRPYVLRSYFDTMLMMGESKGFILRDYRSFFMGHKGDIEHTYTINKGKLPDSVIEDMREAYEKCQEFLQTKKVEKPNKEEMKDYLRTSMLSIAGYSEEEIAKIEEQNLSEKEIRQKVRDRLLEEKLKNNHQRVIQVNELDVFIQEGWEFVSVLPENKAIIRFPS